MEEEEIKHFSHEEHPLILTELQKRINDGGEKVLICYGCQKQILEPKAYCCFNCDFFLHKRCAELPRQIMHPMHSEHPLVLQREPPDHDNCFCDACGQEDWKFFTYNCSICEFDLDVSCAMSDTGFKHENHDHPLIQLRSATFFCNACCAVGEDSSYLCTTCPFWIHKRCASMPQKVDYKDHNHSLLLASSLPSEYRNFPQECLFCYEIIGHANWVYYCGPCRSFVHFQCVLISQDAKKQPSEDINGCISDRKLGSEDREQYNFLLGKYFRILGKAFLRILGYREQCCNQQNLIKLPATHAAQRFITHALHKKDESGSTASSRKKKVKEKISVLDHKHPLILSTKVQTKNKVVISKGWEEKLVCDSCIEPIHSSDLHYTCANCDYFIHLVCQEFPNKVLSPKHTRHRLSLWYAIDCVGHFMCTSCERWSNGDFYGCDPCELSLCIKCTSATFTPTIAHEAHKHLLTQVESSNPIRCYACGFIGSNFGFGCEDCHFYLDYECALLPPSVNQRWDKHPLILVYPPYFEHPEEFYCMFCEQEMNPNCWMYHCRECDYSLHPWCIPEIRLLRNLKFGRSLSVDNHSHTLTHVREAKEDNSFCEGCNTRLDWEEAFECKECRFYLCVDCAFEREYPPN